MKPFFKKLLGLVVIFCIIGGMSETASALDYKREIVLRFAFDFSQAADDDDERKSLKVRVETFLTNVVSRPGVESANYISPTSGNGITRVIIVIKGTQVMNNLTIETQVITALEAGTFPSYIDGSLRAVSKLNPIIVQEE